MEERQYIQDRVTGIILSASFCLEPSAQNSLMAGLFAVAASIFCMEGEHLEYVATAPRYASRQASPAIAFQVRSAWT